MVMNVFNGTTKRRCEASEKGVEDSNGGPVGDCVLLVERAMLKPWLTDGDVV